MAADVVGYSLLMGRDESATLAALKAHRRELIDPKIAEYDGRIVKTTGDGLLLEFASVVDAVRCAVDVQRGMAERNAGVPPVIVKRPARVDSRTVRVAFVPTCGAIALLAALSEPVRADPEVQSIAIAAGVVVVASLLAHVPRRDEPDSLLFEIGRFDPVKNAKQATSFGAEYHLDTLVWCGLRPFVGAGLTANGSAWGYGGIRYATTWGEHIVVTPSFAVGGYSQGHGKDLGHPPVLGRSGLNLEYRLDNEMRIGAAYYHMSNGKALNQAQNPGTEIVGLTVSVPLR